MTTPSGGPAAIRWLREISGMTQRQLAEKSGVSERTIRGLEHGQVNRPHRSSLHALAQAARLGPAQRDAFLRAWAPHRERSLTELNPERQDLILAETMVQSEIEECLVSSHTWFRVGRHGHRVSGHTRCTVEARREGVDSHSIPLLSTAHGQIPSAQLTHSIGCSLLRRHEFSAAGLVVFELGLEKPLRMGELATFEYMIEAGPAGPDLFGDHEPDPAQGGILRMLHRVVDLVVIDVEFEQPPAAVWETAGEGTEPIKDLRELAIHDRRVQIVRRHDGPGLYGFRWNWS